MKPFIKWAGGKRTLAEQIYAHIGPIPEGATYYEPFLGGGAMLLHICPETAVCFDINEELINLYNTIKDNPEELLHLLKEQYFERHSTDFYYQIRNIDRRRKLYANLTQLQKAARFLYLNRTCYNGLWRVNSLGQNNVPMGRYKNPCIINSDEIIEISQYFNTSNINFINRDYKAVLEYANENDVVYFDPPYDIEEEQNGFVAYTKGGFNREEQLNLKLLCDVLVQRGVTVVVSNSNTEYIRAIYSTGPVNYQLIDDIVARRSIGSNTNSRRQINELLIIGRP
jgi:DNA adenine methylase